MPSFIGFTPLLKSVNVGNEEIAQMLIEKGANLNATNNYGDSALHLAAKSGKNQLNHTQRSTFVFGRNIMER